MKNRTTERFIQRTCLVTSLLLCAQPASYSHGFINQPQTEVKQLEPGRNIEREIAGGESHTHQIQLATGQFVRLRLEQRALDSVLILVGPDGEQIAEVNLTDSGELESLALEALRAGSYRLTVRGIGGPTMSGSYLLEATVQASATRQDRKYLAAQALLLEAQELAKQSPKAAPQAIEKLEQTLPIWRELAASYGWR